MHPMKSRTSRILGLLLIVTLPACGSSAEPTNDVAQLSSSLQTPPSAPGLQSKDNWHKAMAQSQFRKKGCFQASYPNTEWEEVQCATAPPIRVGKPPKISTGPQTVGGSTPGFAAQVTGSLTEAIGSFPSASGLTRVDDSIEGYNFYTLQVNTNVFTSPACAGALDPTACLGWQQFIYTNYTNFFGLQGGVYIQYWLINYANRCPSGWNTFGSNCWKNSRVTDTDGRDIKALTSLKLHGAAGIGPDNSYDAVVLNMGSDRITVLTDDSVLNLSGKWKSAEFNVFGWGNSSQAVFNRNVTLTTQVELYNGTVSSPTCILNSTTAETNNLSIVQSSCCPSGGIEVRGDWIDGVPKIVFTESNNPSATAPFCFLNDLVPIQSPML
jgi:hypothetical protein